MALAGVQGRNSIGASTYRSRIAILGACCLLPFFAVSSGADSGLPQKTQSCRLSWQTLSEEFKDNLAELKFEWSKLEPQCQGTGSYEYHRATLLEQTGDRRGAISYIDSVLKRDIPDKDQLRVTRIVYRFSEALMANPPDTATLAKIHAELEGLLRTQPESAHALTENARELVALKDYDRAFGVAKKAVESDPSSWPAGFWLVIAGEHAGQCQAIKPYIVPTIKLRGDSLLANQDFMDAAAVCYLNTGEISTAENALKALAQRNAAVKQDPEFLRLARAVLDAKLTTERRLPP